MATNRPFAYNPTHISIDGTYNIGDLAIGCTRQNYNTKPGGLTWWGSPDELQGFVIAVPNSENTQPTPLFSGAPSGHLTLSSTYRGSNVVLSNGAQTAYQQLGYEQSVLGETLMNNYDKVMFSVLCSLGELSGSHFIGFGKTSMNYQGNPYGGYPGNDNQSIGFDAMGHYFYNDMVEQSGLPTWGDGDIIDIAVNVQANKIWIRVNGGEWNNNTTTNDPATNNGTISSFDLTNFYPVLCPGYEGTMVIQNNATYGVPEGFTLLGTNINASVEFLGTKVYPNPFSDSTFCGLVNQYFNQNFTGGTEAGVWLTNNNYWHSYKDGLTPETAGDSAAQIKRIFPSSQDGLYWIKNCNISGGTPFQIYADMTTDGGGWTLLVTNQSTIGWTYENSILLNEFNPVIGGSNYSIVAYADYIKGNGNFQYMIDAYERGRFGGIWTAPQPYSFVYTANTQTNITLNIKFGTWNYNNDSIEQIMPYRGGNNSGILTTSNVYNGEWWGTIITNGGWTPAPWISSDCGAEGCMPDPGIIWYWVRGI